MTVIQKEVQQFALWDKAIESNRPLSFDLELTARCNNNCRHCYINMPAQSSDAISRELTFEQIEKLAAEAVLLGAIWCTLSGGEPLLRHDFADIYIMLRKKGLLVTLMTNAALINQSHIELFLRYPPRDIEITIYGASPEVYDRVTRVPGSHRAFLAGIHQLQAAGIGFRLKAMIMQSNHDELDAMVRLGEAYTKDYFRYDFQLHLRYDSDMQRNREILDERLTPEQIVAFERRDPKRSKALQSQCNRFIAPRKMSFEACAECSKNIDCEALLHHTRVLHCAAGKGTFTVSWDGKVQLCGSLRHPDTVYDLASGSLLEAWTVHIPSIQALRSSRRSFLETCKSCPIIELCMWCAAHAHLEHGELDAKVNYFCKVAQARAAMITGDERWLHNDPWAMTSPDDVQAKSLPRYGNEAP